MDSSSQELQPKSSYKPSGAFMATIIIVFLMAGGVWCFMSSSQSSETAETNTVTSTATTPTAGNAATTTPATIKNDTDLQTASADLDSSNPDSIDTTLSQNDADASQF